jgi:hypothetical protein
MKSVDKIMNEINAEYWANIYYGWKSKQLFAEKPDESYSVLAMPPENNQNYLGFGIGDLIQWSDSEMFAGQITMIWPSMNRVEISLGGNKYHRGNYSGGSIDNLKEATLLVSRKEIIDFFVNNKIINNG